MAKTTTANLLIVRDFEGLNLEDLARTLPKVSFMEDIPLFGPPISALVGAAMLSELRKIISGGDPNRVDPGGETARVARFYREHNSSDEIKEEDIAAYEIKFLKEKSASVDEIEKLKMWFKKKYGVSIQVVAHAQKTEYLLLTPSPLYLQFRQLNDLKKQLVRIPPDLFRSTGIRSLILTGGIKELKSGKSDAACIIAPEEKIYFFQTWSFYHELFHRQDFQDGGYENGSTDLGSFLTACKKNREWQELESKEDQGRKLQRLESKKDKKQINDPDKEDVDEEQAHYANMLFNLDEPSVRRVVSDPRPAKVAWMKEFLFKWSGGRLNEQYWLDIEAGKVDEFYWDKPQ